MATGALNMDDREHKEGFLHYVAREGRQVLRWSIGVSMIAIVVCMVSPGFFFLAVVPAIVLLGSYVLLVLANEVERRSDTVAHDALERSETAMHSDVVEDHAEDNQLRPNDAEIARRESRIGIAILAGVIVAAMVVAKVFLDWKVVAIGAMVLFAYMLLIAAPLLLGWFNDDIEDETVRLERQPEAE